MSPADSDRDGLAAKQETEILTGVPSSIDGRTRNSSLTRLERIFCGVAFAVARLISFNADGTTAPVAHCDN